MPIRSSERPGDGSAARGRTRLLLLAALKLTAALGAVGAAVLLWLFLAPASAGGVLSATAVSGSSMRPAVRTGDLVVLVSLDHYHVGQVVAYRNRAVAHTFLHRIVGIRNGRFLMRGDRNRWLDPGRIAASDIIGAMLLRIPHGGALVTWLQVPLHGALLAAAVTGSVAIAGGGVVVRRRRRRRRRTAPPAPPRSGRRVHLPLAAPAMLAATAVALVAAGAGAAAAFAVPATDPGRSVAYRQSAGLVYSATVPRSVVYPTGALRTGDPVYLSIVRSLDLTFRYDFTARAPHRVGIGATLAARVSDGNGWRRALPLTASVVRHGDGVVVRARLSLADAQRLLTRVQLLTGVGTSTHALALDLRGAVTGTVAGHPIRIRLDDHTGMLLDSSQLQTGTPRASAGGPQLASKTESGRLILARARPRRWAGGGLTITVAQARTGLAGTALAAATVLVVGLYSRTRRRPHADDVALAEARHGRLIVPLAVVPELPSTPLDVLDMRSLVMIAQRYDAVILHHAGPGGECFLVVDGESVFRYARPAPGWELAIIDADARPTATRLLDVSRRAA